MRQPTGSPHSLLSFVWADTEAGSGLRQEKNMALEIDLSEQGFIYSGMDNKTGRMGKVAFWFSALLLYGGTMHAH